MLRRSNEEKYENDNKVSGTPVLHYPEFREAIRIGNLQEAEALLEAQGDPKPLYAKFGDAVRDNSLQRVKALLEAHHPSHADWKDTQNNTPLHVVAAAAVEEGDEKVSEEMVRMILAYEPEWANEVSNNGATALYAAALSKNAGVPKILLPLMTQEALNARVLGQTALHIAATRSETKGVVKELLIYMKELINATDYQYKTALDLATEKGNNEVIKILSNANRGIFEAPPRVDVVEESKTPNKSDQESKKFHYSKEKISKLLEIQLKNQNNVKIKVEDLAKGPIPEQQIQHFIDLAIQGRTLAIALHLHGEAWTSLVLKSDGGNNLQIIYNDPTSRALSKERAVRDLEDSLRELNSQGTTFLTDLRKLQQKNEADSGALVVDNLVKLATAPILSRNGLQDLLSDASKINKLKTDHSLIENIYAEYNSETLEKILELSLKDQPVTIAPITFFDNAALLVENTIAVAQRVMDSGNPIVMPLSVPSRYWSGLVIKKQPDDNSLQVIYINSTGNTLMAEENAQLVLGAIMRISPAVHTFDISYVQDNNNQSSGVFTVNNLVRLATGDTTNIYHIAGFQGLIAIPLSIDEMRDQHTTLLRDYDRVIAPPEAAPPASEASRVKEASEYKKGDHPDGNENQNNNNQQESLPPAYVDDVPLQVHITPAAEPVGVSGDEGIFPDEVT